MAGESRSGWLAGLAPGAVLAGYRLEARIGAGGMAVVFRAIDERLGRTVALKVLASALAGDGEFRERFVRESRAAATVDHPHIIPVYGAGEADGILFLAMRYVPGGDLRSGHGQRPGGRRSAVAGDQRDGHAARRRRQERHHLRLEPAELTRPRWRACRIASCEAFRTGVTSRGSGVYRYRHENQKAGGRKWTGRPRAHRKVLSARSGG